MSLYDVPSESFTGGGSALFRGRSILLIVLTTVAAVYALAAAIQFYVADRKEVASHEQIMKMMRETSDGFRELPQGGDAAQRLNSLIGETQAQFEKSQNEFTPKMSILVILVLVATVYVIRPLVVFGVVALIIWLLSLLSWVSYLLGVNIEASDYFFILPYLASPGFGSLGAAIALIAPVAIYVFSIAHSNRTAGRHPPKRM